jgi:hypothetical protein
MTSGIFNRAEKEPSSKGASYLAPLLDGFSDELEKIAGVGSWVRGKVGKTVVDGITKNPENRQVAEKFVRDAAWSGVKDGLKRNAGKIGLIGGAAGVGAMAMHQHGKVRRQQEREQLLDDLSSRMRTKLANLSGSTGAPTTMSQVKSTIPRNTMKPGVAKYSKVNSDVSESPVSHHQPVLSPPPVRG